MCAFWIEKTQRWAGPGICIDCPWCARAGVNAATYDQRSTDWYFGVLPILTSRSSWVVCSSCGGRLYSRVKVAELAGLAPSELTKLVYPRASFIQGFLALAALCVAVFPVVGLVMTGIALFANWKLRGWTKSVCYVALAISLLSIALVGALLAIESLGFLPRR
jgi:hypothetical protein